MAGKKEKQYGVVDVGSNSVRLSVYVKSDGAYPLRKVFDEKQVVGLSSYVNGGLLNDEGIRAAAKVVNRQVAHARLLGCENLCVFATAALRNCSNSKSATKMFSKAIGLPVDLITGSREAELGFAGILPEVDLCQGFLADIGGGSTEISAVRKGKVAATTSIPLGSLSLWRGHVAGLLPTRTEFEECREQVKNALLELDATTFLLDRESDADRDPDVDREPDAARSGLGSFDTLYGIGGTIRTVNKMWAAYAELQQADAQTGVTPEYVSRDQVKELVAFALDCPDTYGHLLARIEPTRIHTVTSGLAILSELLDWTGAERVRRSKHGIREGYVLTHMV